MFANKRVKYTIVLSLFTTVLLAASFLFYKHNLPNSNTKLNPISSHVPAHNLEAAVSNNTASSTQGVETTPLTSLPSKKGYNAYSSSTNKIGFYYIPKDGNANYSVKEQGNQITLYDTNNPANFQFAQVFQKNPTDSIQTAITKAVLSGYNPTDCPISAIPGIDGFTSPNFQTAVIKWDANNGTPGEFGVADYSKCPGTYVQYTNVRFFLTDSNHPSVLLFFDIAPYPVSGGTDSMGKNLNWDQTLTFLN
jgi:hypothetical protein